MFLSIVNASRSGRIRTVKHRILQVVFLRLTLRLPICGTAIPTADRPRSAHLCHMAEAVASIALPKRGVVGKRLTRIPGAFNHYAPGAEGVRIVYGARWKISKLRNFFTILK